MGKQRLSRALVAWTLGRGVVFALGAVLGLGGHLFGAVLVAAALATTLIPGPLGRARDGWITNWVDDGD